jgi:hypothetical protein
MTASFRQNYEYFSTNSSTIIHILEGEKMVVMCLSATQVKDKTEYGLDLKFIHGEEHCLV